MNRVSTSSKVSYTSPNAHYPSREYAMTDVIAILFVDVYLSKAKLTSFPDGNCILIESTLGEYCLRQMLLRMLADGSASSQQDAWYNCHSSKLHIAFHAIWGEIYRNIR